MTYNLEMIIKIATAAILAVLMGNGSVVAFNNIRPEWFEDTEEEAAGAEASGKGRRVLPPALVEADKEGRQRLPSSPWKYAFVGYFGMTGLYLALRGGSLLFEISVLCVLFVILEMAVSDQLYGVIPDQFSLCLAVTSIAFLEYNEKWWEPLAGAGVGLAVSVAVLGLGMLLFRKGSIGGGDIKFFTCMGLVAGVSGIVLIYILTTVIFAVQMSLRIAMGKGSIRDSAPLMPAALAAVTVYYLFLWNTGELLSALL